MSRRPAARPSTRRTVLVCVPVALVLLLGLVSGGPGGLLVCAGLSALAVALLALVRGGSRTFRIRTRSAATAVLVAGLAVTSLGGGAYGAAHPDADRAAPAADAAVVRPSAVGTTSAVAASSTAPARGSALAVLATLPVKGRAPMTGYQRTVKFGAAWLDVDRNGCDTRDDILKRDLTDVKRSRCTVRSGVLADPYTGKRISFLRGERTSSAVQIDHVVALGDAWQTGAQHLTQAKRIALANDPINLYAVDGPANQQKSDSDAASWLPPVKAFRCTYVAHQVGVKKAYGLWVTKAEKAAMQRVLSACPTAKAPVSTVSGLAYTGPGASPSKSATPKPTPTHSKSPAPTPTHSKKPAPVDAGVVHPGAYCSPVGALGHTAKGTSMTCRTTATDSRARWRSSL